MPLISSRILTHCVALDTSDGCASLGSAHAAYELPFSHSPHPDMKVSRAKTILVWVIFCSSVLSSLIRIAICLFPCLGFSLCINHTYSIFYVKDKFQQKLPIIHKILSCIILRLILRIKRNPGQCRGQSNGKGCVDYVLATSKVITTHESVFHPYPTRS
jgi:hypothetical protein